MIPRLRFFSIVAISGAVIMALEILSSRLLAPEFGNSVYVWGSIISVFLAALSAGYFIGGKLADRFPRLPILARLLLLAAVGEAVLLLAGEPMVGWLGGATGGSPWGTLVATAILFGPVSVLLATVSPFAVRLAAYDVGRVGGTAGQLYAISTAGSLVGTLGCTFGLIPFFALEASLSLLVALTAGAGILGLVEAWRREVPALALGLVLIAFAGSDLRLPGPEEAGLVATRVTPYQTLEVLGGGGALYLESDRVIQSGIRRDDGEPAVAYPRFAALPLVWNPDARRFLVLGMGPASVDGYLRRRVPDLEVDYVEIDPAVPELAAEHFGFVAGDHVRVHVDDGRRFLRRSSDRTWDVIYSDVFIGSAVPFHLTTVEFFEEAKERLSPDGIFAANLIGSTEDVFVRSIYRTLRRVFPVVEAFEVPLATNLLLLAVRTDPPELSELERRAEELDLRWSFDPSLSWMLGRRIAIDLEHREALLLRDRHAPVNWLVRARARPEEILPPAYETEAAASSGGDPPAESEAGDRPDGS